MKKWLLPLVGLTIALAAAVPAISVALTGDGTLDDPPPIRSDEGIDPNECHWVHNIIACGDGDKLSGDQPPVGQKDMVLAPIDSVEIWVAESDPPSYLLHVVSGLPNGCVRFDSYDVVRDGNTIWVAVTNLEPTDKSTVCTQIYGTVEHNIWLGSDFEPGKTYTVYVNGVSKTFTVQ